jgi:outer membrane autotransporter protein
MKGKQLRKAVLLGMAISMAAWTTGMAREPITDDFTYNGAESITVTNTEEEQAAIQVTDKEVSIKPTDEGSTIKLESSGSGIRTVRTEGGSNGSTVTLTSSGGNEIYFNTGNDKKGDGITVEDNSHVTVTAENGQNYIHAENYGDIVEDIPGGDGIRIQGDGTATVTGQTNKIEVIDDGLYIHQDSGDTANITLTATGSDAEGIGNYIDGNNGIHTDGENKGNITVTANGSKNVIHGTQNAVYNSGSGTINIIASANSTGEGISLLEDHIGVDNILTAGENGVISDGIGETNVIADNDNIIAGTTNGILSENAGVINVTAGNDNSIGQYTDENDAIVTSQNGIRVSQGTVSVAAENQNSIYGTETGIMASGENSKVILRAETNNIKVENDIDNYIYGIKTDSKAEVEVNSTTGIRIDIDTDGVYADAIKEGNGSSVVLQANNGNIDIDVLTGAPNASGGNVDGIDVEGDNTSTTLTAGKNISITTTSSVVEQVPGVGANDVSGIRAQSGANVTATAGGSFYIDSVDRNSANVGIRAQDTNANIEITANGIDKNNVGIVINSEGKLSYAVYAQDGKSSLETTQGNVLVSSTGTENSNAVYNSAVSTEGVTDITSKRDIILTAETDGDYIASGYAAGIFNSSQGKNTAATTLIGSNITVSVNGNNNATYGVYGYAKGDDTSNDVNISGNNVSIEASGHQSYSYGICSENSDIDIEAKGSTSVISNVYGIYANANGNVTLTAEQGSNSVTSTTATGICSNAASVTLKGFENNVQANTGIWGLNGGSVFLTAMGSKGNEINATGYGVFADSNSDVMLTAEQGINSVHMSGTATGIYSGAASVTLKGFQNDVQANTGIWGLNSGNVSLNATDNQLIVDAYGAYADTSSDVNLTAMEDNSISAGTIMENEDKAEFGNAYGVYALSGSTVALDAGNQNSVFGAVFANGSANDVMTHVTLDGASNVVQSAAAIANAGDLNDGRAIISSLYAEDGAQISVSGAQNVIRTYAEDPEDPNTLERTIWAYNTADITIDGQTYISTDRYEETDEAQKGNSADIAIAAGTAATGLNKPTVEAPVPDRATVSVKYDTTSAITGDILSAYAGQVDITPKSDTAQMHITGNILAGNNGVLNVNLGNGGTLTGRADDYGDAGVINGSSHTTFFDPAFSSEIFKGGEVNLTMGDNSRWNVTGQSWITRINTEGSSNAIIDLVSANTDRNASAHALTIYEMNGDAIFNMSLDADRTVSDMVYMKNATGDYVVNVVDPVTQADMYAGKSDGGIFDGLRFATVGKGSKASFRAITWDQGVNNIEYEVGTDSYDTSDENHHYDSSTGNGAGDTEKPGTDLVEGFFGSEGTPGAQEAPANGIMMMAARADEGMGTNTDANGTEVGETTNFKLIGVKSSEISDAGKTVVAMSRINYSNAVYMDRLNKRMGEARYIDGDEGLWVRMRHDRIGKSDAFRSMNTMMELGYDTRVNDREDGEHRQGVAIDYMRGTADYKNVAGEGDVRRGGIWFYDTWLGNKGHYTDYVLKFGRLSNDFELYTRTLGEKVTGDYSNFVYSASAEYGRKKDLGNNWYIEPQAQIQYAHVTDADYTTSQDTHVQLDAIDSLIGRVGFRLGKDVGEKSTFYIKADVLHEFLGDQDIEARDATGLLSTTYENEGTWYDIGLGFSHQFSKGTYMYLDMEKSIGNDNEDTYQFNFGMNWKV